MSLFLDHLRTSARALIRTPLASISIVATLAVCIGATTAVFSIVDAILVRGLPFRDSDRLVWITSVNPDGPDGPFTLPELLDFRERLRTVDLAAFAGLNASITTNAGVERLQGMRLSANAFDVLGVQPALGRLLQPADDAIDAPRVVVVSYGFWQRQLAGRRDVVGEALQLNGERYAIAGVLPKYFPMQLRNVDIIVPLAPDRDPRRHVRSSVNFLRFFGRLQGPATLGAGERELAAIAKDLRTQFPTEYAIKLGVRVKPLQDALVGDHRPTLFVLLGCVGLMLAIALANVLNLLLIRATTRQSEIAVRRALGASARQVSLHLLAEGTLLAGAGSAIGAALAYGAVSLAVSKASANVPRLEEARVDGAALAFAVGLAIVATILFAAVPLLVALRTPPQAVLRASSRTNASTRAQTRLRGAFIVSEIALALVLTTATAGLLESLVRLQKLDLGYRTDSVFVARLSLPAKKYATGADLGRFQHAMHAALSRQPGVVANGVISIAPLAGALATTSIAAVGNIPPTQRDWPIANYRAISSAYFTSVRGTLVAGRMFDDHDDESGAPVAIVNRTIVDRVFAGANPIGKQLMVDDNSIAARQVTIVGVAANMRDIDLDAPPPPVIFVPIAQIPRDAVTFIGASQFWAVRVATNPSSFAPAFLNALREVDGDVATSSMGPMTRYVERLLATRTFSVTVLLGFAVISLVLATLGVYGVMAYSVEQRRRELGVRLALGASPVRVVAFVLRNALGLSATGVGFGVVGAILAGHSMAGLLFGVKPGEPAILFGAAALLLVASVVASWIPASRASRIDPLAALSA